MAFYDRTPRKQYQNADGPGGSTINYGNPRGKSQDQRYREAREKYGNSPWYGREKDTTPMPLIDEDTPFWSPNPADPRNAGYYVQTDPAVEAARDAAIAADKAKSRAAYNADPAYSQAKAAGDIKGQIAAMLAMKQANQQQRFIDQGGAAETWQNRFNTEWPVPASPSGNYQYGPGRPGPTPPGVAQSAPPASPSGGVRRGASPSGGMPPSANPMFQGYSPGTPSKSGMGQSPNMGASTGQSGLSPNFAFRPDGVGGSGPVGGVQGGMPPGMTNTIGDFSSFFQQMQGVPGNFGMGGGFGMGGAGMGGFGGGMSYGQISPEMQAFQQQRRAFAQTPEWQMNASRFAGSPIVPAGLGGGRGFGYNPSAQFSQFMNPMMGMMY